MVQSMNIQLVLKDLVKRKGTFALYNVLFENTARQHYIYTHTHIYIYIYIQLELTPLRGIEPYNITPIYESNELSC